jgi:hypothetical protein
MAVPFILFPEPKMTLDLEYINNFLKYIGRILHD